MVATTSANTQLHYAMYLRQSLDAEGNEIKVDTQRKDVTEKLLALGGTWDEFKDNDLGASGRMPGSKRSVKPRPDYNEMTRLIKAGKARTRRRYDGIAVSKSDRLYRTMRELEDIIDLADEKGLDIVTVGSGHFDLSTPEGRAAARMTAVFARQEMEQKSVRQKRANRRMAEDEARPWWPSRPFGYDADLDPMGKWWTVRRDASKKIIAINTIRKHPVEAKLLKEAYRRFNAGTTVRTIATEWNAKGIKTPRGNKWTGASVRALLLAARNAGLREYGGKVLGEGSWEKQKIVKREVWEQAVRRLADPKRGTGAPSGRKYLLTGIARCGVCGVSLRSAISNRGKRNYACRGCQRISRNAAKLDAVIIEAVVRWLSRDNAVDLLRPKVDPVDEHELREQRRALHESLVQLGKDFATAPPEFTKAALADIQAKLDNIDAVLLDPGKAAVFEGVIGVKDVRKAFLGLDLGRQRTIVDALMTITVLPVGKATGRVFDPDNIDVKWK
jgi:DNA invertase Pin-like site-specific DNA recombinase